MSDPSSPSPMLDRAASLIRETFVVSSKEAQQEAASLVDLVTAKSGNSESWEVLENYILRDLGRRLEWRRAEQKAAEQCRTQGNSAAYNAYIDAKRPSWNKK